jgi:hypothetical protein
MTEGEEAEIAVAANNAEMLLAYIGKAQELLRKQRTEIEALRALAQQQAALHANAEAALAELRAQPPQPPPLPPCPKCGRTCTYFVVDGACLTCAIHTFPRSPRRAPRPSK